MENEERDFKGVWIPAEIWLDKNLTAIEKFVFLEIDSLDNGEGCRATNKYLAEFCQCTERTITNAISRLTEIGYIYQKSFDGRKRVLGSNINKHVIAKKRKADTKDFLCRVEKFSMQGGKICEADTKNIRANNIESNIMNNIDDKKENISKEKSEFENLILSQEEPLREPLREFIKMRKTIRKPLTVHAFDLIIKDVKKFADGDIDKGVKILEQSIKNSWQGVFDLKEYEEKPKPIKRQLGIIV